MQCVLRKPIWIRHCPFQRKSMNPQFHDKCEQVNIARAVRSQLPNLVVA